MQTDLLERVVDVVDEAAGLDVDQLHRLVAAGGDDRLPSSVKQRAEHPVGVGLKSISDLAGLRC